MINKIEFKDVIGVGDIKLDLDEDKRVYCFIGENGVGKTKLLESLFQFLFFSYDYKINVNQDFKTDILIFKEIILFESQKSLFSNKTKEIKINLSENSIQYEHNINYFKKFFNNYIHNYPILFLGSQSRGFVKDEKKIRIEAIGSFKTRQKQYLSNIVLSMENRSVNYKEPNNNFSTINMNTNIDEWFVTIASSSNRWQKKEDNREIEIYTLLGLLNKIDNRFDKEFLEIDGNNQVYLKVDNKVKKLSELSSGFTSLLKIIQSIISGYAYFTNETNLAKVKGIVLIDEIESHLHISWQSKIIPLLKRLFPNTTFYITTHSSIILAHLKEGEAYKLYRDSDEVVKTQKIENIQNYFLSDIVNDVFGVDLNRDRLENVDDEDRQKRKEAGKALLDFIENMDFEAIEDE